MRTHRFVFCTVLVIQLSVSLSISAQPDPTTSNSPIFVRGDCNGDGTFDIADGIFAIKAIFTPVSASCDDSCDSNDDGTFGLADVVHTLSALFSMGPDPLPPFPGCGSDPTTDALRCEEYENCP